MNKRKCRFRTKLLRKREQRQTEPKYLKQIFDYIQDGIIIMNHEREILVMNPSAERMTGWRVGGHVPYCSYCQTREIMPGEDRCYLMAKREVPYFLSAMPTYEGQYIDMEMSTAVIYENEEGSQHEVLLVLKDLTVKKKEEEARISKLVLQKTLECQENEHKRLAQELHDGVGQSLYSISVGLQAIQAQIQQDERFKEYVREIVDELDKVIQDVKLYSLQLRPHSLDRLGLIPTVNHLVGTLAKTHRDIHFSFSRDELPDTTRLSPVIEINLYRVIQEALHNALKYSHASHISIKLAATEDVLTLTIEDDGLGFAKDDVEEGLGLKHMEERVHQINGQFQLESKPGRGTRIQTVIPYKEGEAL
ncbi:PAS domain-containing sensor histidine kinase [Brevibacillus dissolubilis]|uniref:PAS domain-containing sensor histidine kinase n=1 Tax=Brevibacillus dissolubilis TaxID=1844116 RepID=UPI0011174BBC|nr:PAS domain-containing sensor histidine kinase [Brevibacillus dissolubilis]